VVKNIEKLFISPDSTIQDAIVCIDGNELGVALVVDADKHLLGTIVDGDIRRAMLAQLDMQLPLTVLLERKPAQYQKPITAPVKTSAEELVAIMRDRYVRHIPLVNAKGQVVDLFHISNLMDMSPALLPVQAVLMAGGMGTRLRPLTEETPKPMLPVGDRPLMERTIGLLRKSGIRHINVTTHFLPEKIRDHFGDGSDFDVELSYVNEEKPLGTAGGLSLIEPPDMPLLVMNGDLLTDINFREMFAYHQEQKALLTVAVRRYEYKVPYGVVESEDGFVTRLSEKPSYGFFVNAGIYLLEPEAFHRIPKEQHTNMTDIIDQLVADGLKVACFPIREYWLDIGQHADYAKAQEDVMSGKVHS
jgi:dTDP-glucose pyrophosphorylase/CBS domain-containing protein